MEHANTDRKTRAEVRAVSEGDTSGDMGVRHLITSGDASGDASGEKIARHLITSGDVSGDLS